MAPRITMVPAVSCQCVHGLERRGKTRLLDTIGPITRVPDYQRIHRRRLLISTKHQTQPIVDVGVWGREGEGYRRQKAYPLCPEIKALAMKPQDVPNSLDYRLSTLHRIVDFPRKTPESKRMDAWVFLCELRRRDKLRWPSTTRTYYVRPGVPILLHANYPLAW